jgi:hypothetical protein
MGPGGTVGTTEQTVYKWRHRDSVHDRSHTPHPLQTTLSPAQEAVAVALRKTLLIFAGRPAGCGARGP